MARFKLPDRDIINISASAVEKIIEKGNGDAALVYLCILKTEDASAEAVAAALNITVSKAHHALSTLAAMGIIDIDTAETAVEENKEPSLAEIADARKNSDFSVIYDHAENIWGEVLSPSDLKRLFSVYDSLSFTPDVLMYMLQYFKDDVRRRYGPGRRLSMPAFEKLAYEWHRLGIDDLDKAEEYVKRKDNYYSKESEVKRALEIFDRNLIPDERKYIQSWLDMGFDTDAVKIAYERTIARTHKLSFRYMDRIFLNWHEKNFHTADEIEKGDTRTPKSTGTKKSDARTRIPDTSDLDRLMRILDEEEED